MTQSAVCAALRLELRSDSGKLIIRKNIRVCIKKAWKTSGETNKIWISWDTKTRKDTQQKNANVRFQCMFAFCIFKFFPNQNVIKSTIPLFEYESF